MTRPILYIAGPYSAGNGRTVADNIAVARRYAVAAANAGWMPFTPHLNTAGFEIDCPGVSHEEWPRRGPRDPQASRTRVRRDAPPAELGAERGGNPRSWVGEAHRVDDPRPVRYGRGDPRAEEVDIMIPSRWEAFRRRYR